MVVARRDGTPAGARLPRTQKTHLPDEEWQQEIDPINNKLNAVTFI